MEIQFKPVTLGIIISSVLAMIAGGYLYTQGMKVWEITKTDLGESTIKLNHQFPNENIKKNNTRLERPRIKEELRYTQTDRVSKTSAQATTPNQMKIKVSIRSANLRKGPGVKFPVVLTSKINEELTVIGWHLNWFRVKKGNKTAWIRNDLAKTVAGTTR